MRKRAKKIMTLFLSTIMLIGTVPQGSNVVTATEVNTVEEGVYDFTADSLGPVTSKDVIYQIITDRFVDGDASNNIPDGFDESLFDGTGTDIRLYQGGDWQGIIDKIPYLKSMGITAVWISAPYSNRDVATSDGWTSYHGYHVDNYFETNKHYGTMEDFQELRDALHDADIKLVIDFVTNHSSESTIDGKLYEPDKDENGQYVFDDSGEPYDYNGDGTVQNLVADPNNDYKGWFHHLGDRGTDSSVYGYRFKELANLADFAQENQEVAQHLENAVAFWASMGIDGIRHDATLHLNPAFVKNLKDSVDGVSDTPITNFGEFFISKPDDKYEQYVSFPDRTGVNNLDFEFYNSVNNVFGNFSEDMTDFGEMLLYTADDYTYENQTVTFIDNHDVTRFRYVQQNDKPYHAALAALLTSRGVPNIYYGTEQYLSAADSGAGRLFMQEVSDFEETVAVKVIKKLSDLRQDNEALAYGDTEILYSDENVIVYKRQFFDNQAIVAINRQPDLSYEIPAIVTSLPDGIYGDELDGILFGESITVSDGYMDAFTLSPGEVSVWSYNYEDEQNVPQIGDVVSTSGKIGTAVNIYGTGFSETCTVTFGGVEANIEYVDTNMISVKVPEGVEAGTCEIVVSDGGYTSNEFIYTVYSGELNQMIFHVNASTNYGENIYIVGSIPELGAWDTDKCTEAMLCPSYPEWFLPVSVPANTTFEFKFIKKDADGNVIWESGSNHVITSGEGATDTLDTQMYYFSN